VNIVGISGSPRPGSVSSIILRAASEFVGTGVEFILYESVLDLPHFNPDADSVPADPAVEKLRTILRTADGVMICTPEYAFSIPSILKNALEWVVSSGELYEKPLLPISTSPSPPGGDKAHAELRMVLKALGARTINEEMLCIGSTRKTISQRGEIQDPATIEKITKAVTQLIQLVNQKPGEQVS